MQREMFPTDSPSKFDKSLMDAYSSIHEGARKGHAAGDSDVEKQASQLASDVRYKAKGKVKPGASKEQMAKVYMSVLASSPAPATVKTMAKKKLLGEGTMDIKGFEIPKSEREAAAKRIKDKTKKKMAEGVRDEDPEEGTKKRKERLEKKRGMKMDDHPQYTKEGMDPVGQEDGDVDNDGDKDKSDEYLLKRRGAIKKAIAKRREKSGKKVSEGYSSWRMDLNYFDEEGKK